jgi:hypothetical protein
LLPMPKIGLPEWEGSPRIREELRVPFAMKITVVKACLAGYRAGRKCANGMLG